MTKSAKNESKKSSGKKPEMKSEAIYKASKLEKINSENLTATNKVTTSKKMVAAEEMEAEDKMEMKKEMEMEKEMKPKTKSEKNKKRFSTKKVLVGLTGLATLLVLLAGGAWIWVLGTPEYTYYKVYTAIKDKNFDKFIEYVDTNGTAEDLVKQESDYLKQNNINDVQAKFSIKGTLEYTFFQYIDSGNLIKILPYDAEDGWKIFDNKEISKDGDSFSINLKTEPKLNNTEGIFGYRKIVFKMKGNKWVISQLQDNPSLDAAKKAAADQPQQGQQPTQSSEATK